MTPKRRCPACTLEKDLTLENFAERVYQETGRRAFRYECRACCQERDKKRVPRREPRVVVQEKPGKICLACGSMPWRVPGIRCPECSLRYKAEEPQDVVLFTRNFDRAM